MSEYLTKKEAISYVGVTERTLDRIIRRLRDKKDKALRTETKGGSRRTYYISKDYLDAKYFPYKKQEPQQQVDEQTTLEEHIKENKEAKQENKQETSSEFSAQKGDERTIAILERELANQKELLARSEEKENKRDEDYRKILRLLEQEANKNQQLIERLTDLENRLLPAPQPTEGTISYEKGEVEETKSGDVEVQKPTTEKPKTRKGSKKRSSTKDVRPKPENTPEPEPIEINPTLGQRVWKFLSS